MKVEHSGDILVKITTTNVRIEPAHGLWFKGLRSGTGHAPVKRYNRALRDLIAGGEARARERNGAGLATQSDAFDRMKSVLLNAYRPGIYTEKARQPRSSALGWPLKPLCPSAAKPTGSLRRASRGSGKKGL
uniref:Uncharacterized protein n=1 Tax=Streptomyces sp. NBC_00049 TaxID=2903617 RepID=A0AAU2K1U1_9ACTN